MPNVLPFLAARAKGQDVGAVDATGQDVEHVAKGQDVAMMPNVLPFWATCPTSCPFSCVQKGKDVGGVGNF